MSKKHNQEKNIIISGLYSGNEIILFKKGAVLVVGTEVFISKETVSAIQVVNKQDGHIVEGAVIAGLWGALLAMCEDVYSLVEIVWTNGEKSLAKMINEDTNQLVMAAYNSVDSVFTEDEKKKMALIATKPTKEVWALIGLKKKLEITLFLIIGIIFVALIVPSIFLLIEYECMWAILGFTLSPSIGIGFIVEYTLLRSDMRLKEYLLEKKKNITF